MTPANSTYNLQVSCEFFCIYAIIFLHFIQLFAYWITNKYLKREHFSVIKNDEQVKRKCPLASFLGWDNFTRFGLKHRHESENARKWETMAVSWTRAQHWWQNKVTMLNFQKPRHFHVSILHKTIAKERQNMMVLASQSSRPASPGLLCIRCPASQMPHPNCL